MLFSPQIVIPANQQTATLMPTAQPLLLNQMPVIAPAGLQFILRPQTTKLQTQTVQTTATPQGLILQPSGQQILQLQTPRSQPQMVRVLTNGVQLAPPSSTTTYVTQLTNNQQQQSTTANTNTIVTAAVQQQQHHQQQQNIIQTPPSITTMTAAKKKPKKKKQKLDLANIMKLSGIGDEDDIQFESDASQSESEHNALNSHVNALHTQQQTQTTCQTQTQQQSLQQVQLQSNCDQTTKKIGNIQISTVATAQPTINATTTPLLQVSKFITRPPMLKLSNTTLYCIVVP